MVNEPHAITRARERYNVELTFVDLKALEQQIADGKSLLVGTDQMTHSPIHLVKHGDTVLRCVVSRVNGHIITFLPDKAELPKPLKPVDKQRKRGKYYTKKDKRKIRRRP